MFLTKKIILNLLSKKMEKYELFFKMKKYKSHLRILGEEFFNRNRISGYYIHENKRCKLVDKIETKTLKKSEIRIKMIFSRIILNKSFMLKDSEFLIKISPSQNKKKEIPTELINENYEEEDNLLNGYLDDNLLNKSFSNFFEDSFPDYSAIDSNSQNESSE